jgi:hypothetical protein
MKKKENRTINKILKPKIIEQKFKKKKKKEKNQNRKKNNIKPSSLGRIELQSLV